jgi:hypothetical protein
MRILPVNNKKTLSRNFVSLGPHKIDGYLGNDTFFVTRKYDGELALVFFDNGTVSAYNSGGTPLPELVVELSANDAISENSRGGDQESPA